MTMRKKSPQNTKIGINPGELIIYIFMTHVLASRLKSFYGDYIS
jgi:hypothetical protein